MIPPIDIVFYPYFCNGCTHRCEKDGICKWEPEMPSKEELLKQFTQDNGV